MAGQLSKMGLLSALAGTQRGWLMLLSDQSERALLAPGACGAWSAKDVLAHINAWNDWLLRVLEHVSAGAPLPQIVRPGETRDAAVQRFNEDAHALDQDKPLDQVMAEFRASYAKLAARLSDMNTAQLAARPTGESIAELLESTPIRHADDHLADLVISK